MSKVTAKMDPQSRQAFVDLAAKRYTANPEWLEQRIQQNAEEIDDARTEMMRLLREQESLQAELRSLGEIGDDKVAQLEAELESLLKLPCVAAVRFQDERLVVRTPLLYCTNPRDGVVRELGEMEFQFNPGGDREYPVMFFNLTIGPTSGYHHPHVSTGKTGFTHACYGNIGGTLFKLVNQYQFVPATLLVVNYLQTYNAGDTLNSNALRYMPVIPPEVVKALGLADVQPEAA